MQDILSVTLIEGLADEAIVVGVDEVGRGSWAGPLEVGIAAISVGNLRELLQNPSLVCSIDDSKKLTPSRRVAVLEIIQAEFWTSIGSVTNQECDNLGMTKALTLASRRGLDRLAIDPDRILLDGNYDYLERRDVSTVIRGDTTSVVIASASVVAKVHRDQDMCELALCHPHWHFEENKGYGTPSHIAALRTHGLSGIHRVSWRYVETLGLKR